MTLRSTETPAVSAHIVLRQRGKQRLRNAEADRAGGKIHIVGIFCTRRIALGALVAAKRFKSLARLPAEQILDGVKDRARMRFDGDAILRSQHIEIESRQDGRERSARGLMPADFQAVRVLAQMIGVVDHPAGEPQDLALKRGKHLDRIRSCRNGFCWRHWTLAPISSCRSPDLFYWRALREPFYRPAEEPKASLASRACLAHLSMDAAPCPLTSDRAPWRRSHRRRALAPAPCNSASRPGISGAHECGRDVCTKDVFWQAMRAVYWPQRGTALS